MAKGDRLPDYLARCLHLVIVGTAAGKKSAACRRYYSDAGNDFWDFAHRSGVTRERLSPDEDERVLEFEIGLTDLAKKIAASSDRSIRPEDYDVEGFLRKMERCQPAWVVFHGKKAAQVVSRALGHGSSVRYGPQPWRIGSSAVFVLPSASGSNRNERSQRLEGKASHLDWWKELAHALKQ